MTELIARELKEIGFMLASGLSVMLVFWSRDMVIEMLELKGRKRWAVYFISWVAASFLFTEFLYCASYGKLSWYGTAAFTAGILLWKRLFCDIISLSIGLSTYEKRERGYEEEKKT